MWNLGHRGDVTSLEVIINSAKVSLGQVDLSLEEIRCQSHRRPALRCTGDDLDDMLSDKLSVLASDRIPGRWIRGSQGMHLWQIYTVYSTEADNAAHRMCGPDRRTR